MEIVNEFSILFGEVLPLLRGHELLNRLLCSHLRLRVKFRCPFKTPLIGRDEASPEVNFLKNSRLIFTLIVLI